MTKCLITLIVVDNHSNKGGLVVLRTVTFGLIAVVLIGCGPSVRVRRHPAPDASGVRYYRPKPYLLVQAAPQLVTKDKVTSQHYTGEAVSISLQYLPDFSEEYAIDVRPGLGSAEVSVELEDGWNLTSINQTLDSNFDENVAAIAELASAAASYSLTGGEAQGSGSTQRFVVKATNVPLGYYESVLKADRCGRKRLCGWRYIGFLPFQPGCSQTVMPCGGVIDDFGELGQPLYGLVFDSGVMTFKPMHRIASEADSTKQAVSVGEFQAPPSQAQALQQLEAAIERSMLEEYGESFHVTATFDRDQHRVSIQLPLRESLTQQEVVPRLLVNDRVEEALLRMGDPVPEFVE